MRKVLITGSSRGVGLAIAKNLLTEGHHIYGLSRSPSPIEHNEYFHNQLNLKEIEKWLPQFVKSHDSIDAIVCNAGFGRFGSLEEFSFSQMKELMDVNFMAHAYLIRAYIPLLKKQKRGNIIFIGSEAALEGKKKGTMYCASKFALRGFAQALRDECSNHNVHVSIIQPGMIGNSFYDTLTFRPGNADHEHIKSEDIAILVSTILKFRSGTIIDEIVLSPQSKKISFIN